MNFLDPKLLRPAALLVVAITTGSMCIPAGAATYVVTRLDDPLPGACLVGDCSLREAVIAANGTSVADIIQLGNGTHELTRSCVPDTMQCQDLDVTRPLTIQGNGSAATEILNSIPITASGSTTDLAHTRVIEASNPLTLKNLRLRGGHVAGTSSTTAYGGCLLQRDSASTLNNVVITNCRGNAYSQGGGARLSNAPGNWQQVKVIGNTAQTGGGVSLNAPFIGARVELIDNRAYAGGGLHFHGYVTVELGDGSRISGNHADQIGGGILAGPAVARVGHLSGTRTSPLEVSANTSDGTCGGISMNQSQLGNVVDAMSARHLKVTDNLAKDNGGGICLVSSSGFGSVTGVVTVADLLVTHNIAGGDGGGILMSSQGNDVMERISLAGNMANRGAALIRATGQLTLRHVSSHDNDAMNGAAFQFSNSVVEARHLTSLADTRSIDTDSTVTLGASAISAPCGGNIVDGGNNVILDGNFGCPGTPASEPQMGLGYGFFGGTWPIVGIVDKASVLRDKVSATGTDFDVQGWQRQNLFDIGAHEYDGITP